MPGLDHFLINNLRSYVLSVQLVPFKESSLFHKQPVDQYYYGIRLNKVQNLKFIFEAEAALNFTHCSLVGLERSVLTL